MRVSFLEARAAGTLEPEPLLPPNTPGEGVPQAGVPTDFLIDVHGETVLTFSITGVGLKAPGKRHFYLTLDGVPQEVVFEPLGEYHSDGGGSGRPVATEDGDVTTTMPGKHRRRAGRRG